jgi:hypothetical protein
MIAINGGTVPRATKTRSIALDSAKVRSHADEKCGITLYSKCDRWLCRPSCFDIAEFVEGNANDKELTARLK